MSVGVKVRTEARRAGSACAVEVRAEFHEKIPKWRGRTKERREWGGGSREKNNEEGVGRREEGEEKRGGAGSAALVLSDGESRRDARKWGNDDWRTRIRCENEENIR
jgi:hypothetical protein